MALTWTEANEAISDAKRTIRQADFHIRTLSDLVVGKLQSGNVSDYSLCKLKRELSRYNMHTGRWKD